METELLQSLRTLLREELKPINDRLDAIESRIDTLEARVNSDDTEVMKKLTEFEGNHKVIKVFISTSDNTFNISEVSYDFL